MPRESSTNTENLHAVITTGGTNGIGLGVVERTLQEDPAVRIINIGQATAEEVRERIRGRGFEKHFPEIMSETDRTIWIPGIDLGNREKRIEAGKTVVKLLKEMNGRVVSIFHCAAKAIVKKEGLHASDRRIQAESMDSMGGVNLDAAIFLRQVLSVMLKQEGNIYRNTRFGVVGSLAQSNPVPPGLERYAELKDIMDAVCGVGKDPNAFCVKAGVFDTEMVRGFFRDPSTPVEFLGAPMAQPLPNHPMMRDAARVLIHKNNVHDIVYPRISRWFCKLPIAARKFALPQLVRCFGRSVMDASGCDSEGEYEARRDYHEEHKTYGTHSPLEKLPYRKLWTPETGNQVASVMKSGGLL